mmetsp:Transcript_513/g.1543  ORF Transcript_513/g.1543 Transcript_513/m.1543 type:complete len:203 (+) Transcript_513:2086-2694(+)
MQHVRLATGLDGAGPVAWLHAQVFDDGRDGVFLTLELKSELLEDLVLIAHGFPRFSEVADGNLGHEVGGADDEVLERVFLFEALSLLFSGGGIDLDDGEVKLAVEGACCQWYVHVSLQYCEAVDCVAVLDLLGSNLARSFEDSGIGVDCNCDVVQPLVVDGILYDELQYDMFFEHMLHAFDNVFCFAFGEWSWFRGSEHSSE